MENEAKQQPPTPKKKQNISSEEIRFNIIRDSLSSHLRPGNVPEPLTNLSTAQNEHLTRLHTLAEGGRFPSDSLANAFFIDAMTETLGEDTAEYFSHHVIRLSKDRKYGYIGGAGVFDERPALPNPRPFILFTLSTTEDGRSLHGKYTWSDVALPPLTKEHDHQYRVLPAAIKDACANGNIPCRGIVFHSFDDDLRNNIVQPSACLPEHNKGVASSVPSHALVSDRSQDTYSHEEIGAIIDQARAFRQQSDEALAPLDRAESKGREPTSYHRANSPTSTRPGRPVLPVPAIMSHDMSNAPQRSISRKGKEKAGYVEEERNEANDVVEESDAEAEVQVQHDHSYAAQLAIAEAKECGFSQELLESMVTNGGFQAKTKPGPDDVTSTAAGQSGIYQGARSEGNVVADSDLDSDQVRARKGNAVDLPPSITPGLDHLLAATSFRGSIVGPNQDADCGNRSPQASDTSPARSEQRPNFPNGGDVDEATSFRDGERRNGENVPGINGPTTPAPFPAEKRKWTTPSTGDSDRPASKYQRPDSEIEDSSSPLSQRPSRGSRNKSIEGSAPRSLPQDGRKFEGTSISDQIGLPRPAACLSRSKDFIPIEEEGLSGPEGVGPVGGSVSFHPRDESATSPNPLSSDTTIKAKENGTGFKPSSGQNPATPQMVDGFAHRRVQAWHKQSTHESREKLPSPFLESLGPCTISANQLREPLDRGSLAVKSSTLPSGTQTEDAPSSTKATASVQTDDILSTERSEETVSSTACASGSGPVAGSSTASHPRQQGGSVSQLQVDRNTYADGGSGVGGYSTGSSGSGSASSHPTEILSLLRGWRASFINVDDRTLAEAGIQITGPSTSPQQASLGVGIEQIAEKAPHQQSRGSETYYSLLVSVLETSRGVLSTVSPDLLAAVGLDIIPRRLRVAALPAPLSLDPPEAASGENPKTMGSGRTSSVVPAVHSNLRPIINNGAIIIIGSRTEGSNTDGVGASAADRPSPNQYALAPTQLAAASSNQVLDTPAEAPPTSSKATKTKAKRKDTKPKGRGDKNTDAFTHDTVTLMTSHKRDNSDGLGDSEMTSLDAQTLPHISDPGVDGAPPSTSRVEGSMLSVRMREFSPMDTEWDKVPDPELSRNKKANNQNSANSGNGKRGEPSDSSIRSKEDHPKGSNATRPSGAQSTPSTSQRKEKTKQPPKKKGSGKVSTKDNSKTTRPGGASPAVEPPTVPSPVGRTPSEPASTIPPGSTSFSKKQTSNGPSSTLDNQDEIMVNVESPQLLLKKHMSPESQIPGDETFGEAPIVPDDEGPPSFTQSFDVPATGSNDNNANPNTPPIEANLRSTPTDQVRSVPESTAQPGTSTAPNTSAQSAVVDQVITETQVPPEQSGTAGSQHGGGSSVSSADAPIHDLANALGLWSFFYEPFSTSQTNGLEES